MHELTSALSVYLADKRVPVISNKKGKFLNIPMAFDTECSSFKDLDGNKVGLMYCWQFGFAMPGYKSVNVCMGRTHGDLVKFVGLLNGLCNIYDCDMIVYVHNLQYDWQVIRKDFQWDDIFFIGPRKPLYARAGRVTFRDSLILSGGRSLEAIGRELMRYKESKAVGDLDYELIRTPETTLTGTEMYYCVQDIRTLLAYIAEKIEDDGNITKIPYTNTGYVRNALRKSCFKDFKSYMGFIDSLVMEPRAYQMMKQVQAGGFTHASRNYYGKCLRNVQSWDIRSSYPAVMCLRYFPMSQPLKVDNEYAGRNFGKLLETKCCMFRVRLENVWTKEGNEFPLSRSKLIDYSGKESVNTDNWNGSFSESNGRVVEADWIVAGFTELDWATFEEFYNYDSMKIEEFWVMERGRLPKPIVTEILRFYKGKTTLKGIEERLLEYNISKNMINAVFGCMTMDPVRDEYPFDYTQNDFYVDGDGKLFLKNTPDVTEAVQKENEKKTRFLFYGWGIWVTAHARRNLMKTIYAMGSDHVYSDTDSEKIVNYREHQEYFDRYNEAIIMEIQEAANYYHISPLDFMPSKPGAGSPESRMQILGTFANEGVYDKFMTYGAKRYLTLKNGEYELTVAGLNKFRGCAYLCGTDIVSMEEHCRELYDDLRAHKKIRISLATRNPFEEFNGDMEIPEQYSGRVVMTYIDECREGIIRDYQGKLYRYCEKSGVYAGKSGFHMGLSADVFYMAELLAGFADEEEGGYE